jgi:hypothetical protein
MLPLLILLKLIAITTFIPWQMSIPKKYLARIWPLSKAKIQNLKCWFEDFTCPWIQTRTFIAKIIE